MQNQMAKLIIMTLLGFFGGFALFDGFLLMLFNNEGAPLVCMGVIVLLVAIGLAISFIKEAKK
jgi:hypothetical protein